MEKETFNPDIKLNELYKYAPKGESTQIFTEVSNPKMKKIINQNVKEINVNYGDSKFRYNNSLNKKTGFMTNKYIESDYDNLEDDENQKIFTTIRPTLNNEINNNEYDNKSYCNCKRITKNKIPIYKKFRTPDRKYTYYKKKKKKDSTDNTYSISYYTDSNYANNNSNIYDSLNENNKTQIPGDITKKMNKLLKQGLKFELNNVNDNYIDLLTIADVKSLENQINIKKLSKIKSPQQNPKNNNNIYIRKTNNKGCINLNKVDNKDIFNNNVNNVKSRNNLSKIIIDKDIENKSYDCITFKKKVGMNKKRKIKQKRNNNSTDKYYNKYRRDKGTPIKKENDRGGKIVLYPKLYSKYNNYFNDPNLTNMNNKYYIAAIIIQKWWKKNNKKFINKVNLIQKAIRRYLNAKNKMKIYQKKTSLKTIYKNNNIENNDTQDNKKENELNNEKEDNKIINKSETLNENYIILIQRKFREYLNNRKKKENKLENIIKYIPKIICEITKIRKKQFIKLIKEMNSKNIDTDNKLNNKENIRNNYNNIRTIRNGNINNHSSKNYEKKNQDITKDKPQNKIINFGKKHQYTRSKLAHSPSNDIFISQDQVKYKTDRYVFFKRCYFRNREEDKEQNEINKACTTEFMRKINLKLKNIYYTPDKNNTKHVNPLLKVDNLEEANIQFLYDKKNKNKKDTKNEDIYKNKNNYKNNNINRNREKKINIDELVQVVNIPYQLIEKCKMEEIVINKNKNKNTLNYNNNEEEEKEDNDKRIEEEEEKEEKEEKIEEEEKEEKEKRDETIKEEEKQDKENKEDKEEKIEKEEEKEIKPEIIEEKVKEEKVEKEEDKENDKENKEKQRLEKIILIQKNIRIFLQKLRPKITKMKKTILSNKVEEQRVEMDDDSNKGDNNIYIRKKTSKKTELIKHKIQNQKLNIIEQNIENYKQPLVINQNEQNNKNKLDNLKINISENDSNKDSISENDISERESQNKEDDNLSIKNINNKIIDKPNNDAMKYVNKISKKVMYINNNIIPKNEEKQYIKKISNKVSIINNNYIPNNEENLYISKISSKVFNINKNLKNDNNEMKYINKKSTKVNIIIKNDKFNDKQEKIDDNNSSSFHLENKRSSCPIKAVKKVSYKKHSKQNLENLLKDNTFKFTINQLKEIGMHYKYFRFEYIVRMFIQKIQKINRQYVFLKFRGEGFSKQKIYFFDVIKTYLNNKNLYINDNNDVSILLKDTLKFYSNMYNKYKFIPYIKTEDENKLINTELFRHDEDCNNLISFIGNYLKLEKNITKFSEDLIKYYLNQIPIKNFNIFGITRHINQISIKILYSEVDKKKLEKKENLNIDYILISSINDINKKNLSENISENKIELDNLDDDNENKKYVRKATINYKKTNTMSMKRHVKKLSSCDINNNSFENLPLTNDSLIKKLVVK